MNAKVAMHLVAADIKLGDLSTRFVEFLPNLIGASVIAAVGGLLLLWLPWFIWKRVEPGLGTRASTFIRPVRAVLWVWTVMAGAVVLSLVVNTLGIGRLTSAFDRVLYWIPRLLVALVVLAIGLGLAWASIVVSRKIFGSVLERLPKAPRLMLEVVGYLVPIFFCFMGIAMAAAQLDLPPLIFVDVSLSVAAAIAIGNRSRSWSAAGNPPPPSGGDAIPSPPFPPPPEANFERPVPNG